VRLYEKKTARPLPSLSRRASRGFWACLYDAKEYFRLFADFPKIYDEPTKTKAKYVQVGAENFLPLLFQKSMMNQNKSF
jgi:hypothetical protein